MRVALVHSFYSSTQPSGENAVVQAEHDALTRAGHEVQLFATRTDDLEGDLLYPIKAGVRVATGWGNNPRRAIEQFEPDIVRVHNVFPNMGRRWIRRLHSSIEVQAVLHNYRLICATGLLSRDGALCTACPDGDRWAAVRHSCYRGSRLATIPVAASTARGILLDPLVDRADRLITLSDLQREVLESYGLPARKTEVWPNFLPDHLNPGPHLVPDLEREGWIFVGRLTREKGLLPLLDAWPRDEHLTVLGDGPLLRDVVTHARAGNVTVAGRASRSEVMKQMRRATGLVFSSTWLEAAPLTYIEALAAGTPVLAIGNHVVAEEVDKHGTGIRATFSDLSRLRSMWQSARPSPRLCRETFESLYSESTFLEHFDPRAAT